MYGFVLKLVILAHYLNCFIKKNKNKNFERKNN